MIFSGVDSNSGTHQPFEYDPTPELPAKEPLSMLPRPCLYPPCKKVFTPAHPRYASAKFCCPEHKTAFWKLAAEIGEKVLLSGRPPEAVQGFWPVGSSHNVRVLDVLRSLRGKEIEDPAARFPGIVWHSRIAELRRKGFRIECRRVDEGKTRHYFYKLIEEDFS